MIKVRLFCLPFAGGSQYSYNGFLKNCPDNMEVQALDLPGRGRRLGEPCLTSMEGMIEDVLPLIREQVTEPYAIYGHSMGSLLGLLLCRRIVKEQLPPPLALILSGRGAPSVKYDKPPKYLLPRPEFVEKLKSMGGSVGVFEDEKLFDFFEPILRADMQAGETYIYEEHAPLNIPITVMVGADEGVSHEEAMAWQKETSLPIDLIEFPGNHFFILDQEKEIMEIISRKLSAFSIL